MINSLSLSPSSVTKLISKKNWLSGFITNYTKVSNNIISSSYPDNSLFDERIINLGEIKYSEHRESIRRWMELASHKGRSLLTIFDQIPKVLALETAVHSKYEHIELGPLDADYASSLSDSELENIRDANIISGFSRSSVLNTCGYFISELFFCYEAMCRVICMGSCLEHFHKTVSAGVTIQHQDVYKSLSQLSNPSDQKVSCKLCKSGSLCTGIPLFKHLKDFYILIYHLRVLRDYKTEYYHTPKLAKDLLNTVVPLGFDVICKVDILMSQSIGSRMRFPLSLSDEKKDIERIKSELSNHT